jgi:two-component system chemotaxis response regulator CheB
MSISISGPTGTAAIASSEPVCRVMVVDDSLVIRRAIARIFEQAAGFKVVATASNGHMAISALEREPADVVVLDIEMPVMDGLTAIPLLKAVDPAVQIIMASTLTHRNAEISLRALALGATDYVSKPSTEKELNADTFNRELLEKARALGAIARSRGVRRAVMPSAPVEEAKPAPALPKPHKAIALRRDPIMQPQIIAIGTSTGGPQALFEVIKKMGSGLPQPVVVTQHMPPSFTAVLAEHIARQCSVPCTEAVDNEPLKPGHYYIAPGDFHMLIARHPQGGVVNLVKTPAENYCRPAVDPMLRSLVETYGKRVMVVMLTGMGYDGCKGSEVVVNAGGAIIAQDEATSVVWGMPGAVAMAGLCSAVLPLGEIGTAVRRLALKGGP